MNLNETDLEIKKLQKQLESNTTTYITPLETAIKSLKEHRWKIVLDQKLYKPMEYLKQFEGQDVLNITLIAKDGSTKTLYQGDIFEIRNGRLYFSDYESGIIEWNNEKQKYQFDYHYLHDTLEFIGFVNLTLGSICGKETRVEETFIENIREV